MPLNKFKEAPKQKTAILFTCPVKHQFHALLNLSRVMQNLPIEATAAKAFKQLEPTR